VQHGSLASAVLINENGFAKMFSTEQTKIAGMTFENIP
jgi:hypothetical protein